jgi:glyoxalase-like protein
VLELDHVYCFVDPAGDWAARVAARGWRLDDGTEHAGQGTRNRRLCFAEQFFEFLWISSRSDAETSPLRLDRRADWRATGACPFGICLRGDLGDHAGFWPYRAPYAPGLTMWIHHGDEAQPAVFGFDAAPDQLERLRPRSRFAATPEVINPGAIREVRLQLPVTPQAVLVRLIPPVVLRPGPPRLQMVLGGEPLEIAPELAIG